MEAVEMKDLQAGWWGVFDSLYGPEKVLDITRYKLTECLGGDGYGLLLGGFGATIGETRRGPAGVADD